MHTMVKPATKGPPVSDADISMAIRVDDLSLLECTFHADTPLDASRKAVKMLITNPDNQFSFDAKGHRTILRALVNVQFGLVPEDATAQAAPNEDTPLLLHFGTVVGVVASAPILGTAAVAARHMAGAGKTAEAQRDKKTEHALRLEAIRAGYSFAQAKLAEMSALSPAGGTVMLPLIDADALLVDLERSER